MSDWNIEQINQLGRVVTGKTPPKTRADYYEGDELFVSPKDFDWNGGYVEKTQTTISRKALEAFKNQVLPQNAVLFTSLSFGFGKMAIASRRLLTNQQINSVIANDDHHFRFIYYLLRAYTPIIFSYNSGIDTPIVPKSVFEKVQVCCPELKLQRKIAAILTSYDDLIETNKRRIALLEKMAEELYREWFVRMRFPGHQKTKFVKGVPEGWKMQKIEEAFEFTGGGTPSKAVSSYWNDGTVNWFTPSDITGAAGIFLSDSEDQCSEEGLARSSAKMFPPYSVMVTSRATIGAIGINTTPACTNQGFITCIPNKRYPLPYLYQWLKLAKPYFEQLCGGATFPELTKATFKKLEIITPPENLIQEFTGLSEPIFKSIQTGLEQNKNLTQTRDLLLPRLISGKLSVEDLDIQLPPSMQEATPKQVNATH